VVAAEADTLTQDGNGRSVVGQHTRSELFPAHNTVLQGCTQPSTQKGAQPSPRATSPTSIGSIENPGIRPRCMTLAWRHVRQGHLPPQGQEMAGDKGRYGFGCTETSKKWSAISSCPPHPGTPKRAEASTHLLIQPALQLYHLDLHAFVQLLVVLDGARLGTQPPQLPARPHPAVAALQVDDGPTQAGVVGPGQPAPDSSLDHHGFLVPHHLWRERWGTMCGTAPPGWDWDTHHPARLLPVGKDAGQTCPGQRLGW